MYSQLVQQYRAQLGNAFKTAADLAAILDHPLTQLKRVEHGWSGPLKARYRVFNILCALFVRAGLEPPALEESLWRASLPHIWDAKRHAAAGKQAGVIKTRVREHIKGQGGNAAQQVRALLETLVLFPGDDESSGIRHETLMAMLNRLIVEELGLPPFRPDYEQIEVSEPISLTGPARSTKILIVDDDVSEYVKSALKLAGIPNVVVEFKHYMAEENSWRKLEGEALANKLAQLSDEIIATKPDIVLMDQGLGDIDGSYLVIALKSRQLAATFVANSGGTGQELMDAGCLDNFSKGERTRGFLQALQYYRDATL